MTEPLIQLRTGRWLRSGRSLVPVKNVKIGPNIRVATGEEIADVQRQLAALANDPSLTLVTVHTIEPGWQPQASRTWDELSLEEKRAVGDGPLAACYSGSPWWTGMEEQIALMQAEDPSLYHESDPRHRPPVSGVVSAETLIEVWGHDFDREVKRLRQEPLMPMSYIHPPLWSSPVFASLREEFLDMTPSPNFSEEEGYLAEMRMMKEEDERVVLRPLADLAASEAFSIGFNTDRVGLSTASTRVAFPPMEIQAGSSGVPCTYCNASGESQKWNPERKMMTTVPCGCEHCGGTGSLGGPGPAAAKEKEEEFQW